MGKGPLGGWVERAQAVRTSPGASQTFFLSGLAGYGKAIRGGAKLPGGVSSLELMIRCKSSVLWPGELGCGCLHWLRS